jgi:protein involved in polysaccharide export with SLBB domain/capsular polysaccharide biosynthesis protein
MWTVLDLLLHRWQWLLLGSIICGVLFYFAGWRLIKPKFTATAQLLRYQEPGAAEFFENTISSDTFVALIRSPELLKEVGSHAKPPIPPEKLVKFIKIDPQPDSDMINLALAGREPNWAVDMLNLYASNAVVFGRAWYSQRAQVVASQYLKTELERMDNDIVDLEKRFRDAHLPPQLGTKLAQVGGAVTSMSTNLANSPASSALITRQRERLDAAMVELNDLLVKYTEIHPLVVAKEQQIKTIKQQITSAPTNTALAGTAALLPPLVRPGDANPEYDIIRMKLLALEEGRVNMAHRQRQAELYAKNPPGVVRVFAPATVQSVQKNMRSLKVGIFTILGAACGMMASLLLVMFVEFADNRLKTVEDLKRVTRLPVLTTLKDLNEMGPEARSQWAFRTWTLLQGRLSPSANHGLVCGITSSTPGEGRSTWISLLAEAASLTGFRVLTIATRPSPASHQLNNTTATAQEQPPDDTMCNSSSEMQSLSTSVLTSPSQVTDKLTGPNSQPVVHIPLPGWVWNLERRKQWGEALGQWRSIENLVILVELPPSSVPEAVLLGSNLPNMLWLASSGSANAGDTRAQLDTLRHARCNLVGAVLNREPGIPLKKRFPRWLACLALSAAMAAPQAIAQQAPAATRTNDVGFSIVRPTQRAAWQNRLTLGPGDVLNFGLYGSPELARVEVAIGPDGRVSYLEAQDVVATGLTIDELRTKIDDALGKYRRAPRTMLTPVAFKSKRYYVLGKVMTKGVYVLDRPLTVVEAIARAHGFENGLVDRNIIDLADLQRSFLMRGGKRYPLNFEKLFEQGDLSQNMAIEPGDYLYFAGADVREVYVVGEIRLPGPVTHTPDTTIVSAITARGGFTERAFKSRVLVVRGSFDDPELIAVNTADIIKARSQDFNLQPNDIIYVNSRPFIRVEELADLAATAFIQSLITSWVGMDVVKPIQ